MMLSPTVSFSGVGHGHPRGQEPHQPNADHQPSKENHRRAGPQAPMGLRKLYLLKTTFITSSEQERPIGESMLF